MTGGKIILIIDDDETLVEVMEMIFREHGYDVHSLRNGASVDQWLATHTPHLILIDYLMPGMNGAQITRHLRRLPVTATTPIIMLAATRQYQEHGLKAGVTSFLTKPFDLDTLLSAVNSYLNPLPLSAESFAEKDNDSSTDDGN